MPEKHNCPKCGREMEFIEECREDIRCDSPMYDMYVCSECRYSCFADDLDGESSGEEGGR